VPKQASGIAYWILTSFSKIEELVGADVSFFATKVAIILPYLEATIICDLAKSHSLVGERSTQTPTLEIQPWKFLWSLSRLFSCLFGLRRVTALEQGANLLICLYSNFQTAEVSLDFGSGE